MNTESSYDYMRRNSYLAVSNQDRRGNGRIYHSASAVIENLETMHSHSAMIINYSNGGLYIESDALFSPGAIIFLGLSNSPYNQSTASYECHRVKVMWYKDLYHAEYKYGYGVQHLDPIDAYTDDIGEQVYDLPQYLKLVIADKKDNRKHPRKPVSKKVLFTSANECYEGTIQNISKGGFFIATAKEFTKGNTINLVVPGTKFDKGVMIKAEIVRNTETGIGVKILGLLKDDG